MDRAREIPEATTSPTSTPLVNDTCAGTVPLTLNVPALGSLAGARNEVLAFQLQIESDTPLANVNVAVSALRGASLTARSYCASASPTLHSTSM